MTGGFRSGPVFFNVWTFSPWLLPCPENADLQMDITCLQNTE